MFATSTRIRGLRGCMWALRCNSSREREGHSAGQLLEKGEQHKKPPTSLRLVLRLKEVKFEGLALSTVRIIDELPVGMIP